MNIILLVSLIILVFQGNRAEEELFTTCPDMKGSKFAFLFKWIHVKLPYRGSKFFIALKNETRNDGLVEINKENLSTLKENAFDVSLKTYVIIHGYRSNFQKPWILELKNKILKKENANVILVDWREASYSWNYLHSVRTTTKVSKDLFQMLQSVKTKVSTSNNCYTSCNHLYFIGHSLGAHIAGQTGYLLRKDDRFFKVKRITGLDPAWPCFTKAKSDIKLDKQHADFVDVIHTQTSIDDKKFAFGLKKPMGHVDYYINSGVEQPACKSNSVFRKLEDKICSHKMAAKYFVESMNNTKSCPLEGHPWDQTYENAMQIFANIRSDEPCNGCVELGKDISNKVESYGTYLVLTSAKAPYCLLKKDDLTKIWENLKLLLPTKKRTTWGIFNTDEKNK